MVFTRTLNFQSKDLGNDTVILLTFDDPTAVGSGLFKDKFPICWKVAGMPGKGPGQFTVTYRSQLAFTKPQVDSKNMISAGTYVDIDLDQKTDLKTSSVGPPAIYDFSAPIAGTSGQITVANKTDERQSIGVGFHVAGYEAETALLWEGVVKNSDVVAQFTPVLRGYATSSFKENQVLRGAVQSDVLFSNDLTSLAENTTWVVAADPASGEISIKPA